jgi:signal transduction histidine kinase
VRARRPGAGRLRRRLAIAFTLVGALSSGALAVGAYAVVRSARMDDAVERALTQTDANVAIARSTLRGGGGAALDRLLRRYASRPGFVTVPVVRGRAAADALQPPQDLRRLVGRRTVAYRWASAAGHRYLVVGAPVRGVQLYFFFDEQQLDDDLAQLREILLVAWLALALLSAAVGVVLARRTLAPVADASRAAHALAEGLLDTRLPRRGEDEFGDWAASFNEMADALEAKIEQLSEARERERRFTADVAHELRTPLTALVNEATILAAHLDELPPGARRAAELLALDVGRLRRLVEDLLEMSRLESGAERVSPEPVEVRDLVDAIVAANGWRGQVHAQGGAIVQVDPRRLERIVANLLANGVEHGGGANVRMSLDGGELRLAVADAGPGIPAEQLARIFDRFTKGDPARRGGSGLGLAIARENARLLGGRIDVASRPGETVFTVSIPVAEPLPGGDGAATRAQEDEGVEANGKAAQ